MRGLVSTLRACAMPNVYAQVPDGGWGWTVALAFFFVEVFTYGIIKIFGIFLQDLTSHFAETNSRVSWVISICVFVMTFTAPLSTVLSNRFGYRPVVMLGGFLIALGTFATAFTYSVTQMYVTVGLVSGLGYCLTFLPTVTVLSQYFSKRRSLVTAVASTGECFSLLVLAPAFSSLKDQVGWRRCLMVIALLQASVIVCGALLKPIIIQPRSSTEEKQEMQSPQLALRQGQSKYELENEFTCTSIDSVDSGVQTDLAEGPAQTAHPELEGGESVGGDGGEVSALPSTPLRQPPQRAEEPEEPSPPRRGLLDVSVLKDGGFICYSLFGLFATLAFFAPQLYIIELSVGCGMERESATYMLSTMAVAEILGRLSIGWVLNRGLVRKLYILLVCTALLSLVLVFFPFVTEFWGLASCCAAYGFLLGTVASTHIPMLAEDDVVGIEKMPTAAGVYVFIQSFAGLAGPPLGGVLVDITHNYGSAFYSSAAGAGLGALVLGLVRPAKARLRRYQEKSVAEQEREQDTDDSDSVPADFLEVDMVDESRPDLAV
ncbi:solute carrier family 16 member 6b isoform X1 [Electrophorus electricus]|uniref:Monocarboxylate transporter 7 n=1 Tax=Electrophorus electricus TaxID=8005 RepID=A0A4W4GDE3_ELEEL|nr:solute carrier family 16 member 6b isoform X1 [Electrophorus electricus]